MRIQVHDGYDLINQFLVELRSISDPGVLHDCISGWTVFRVGGHAVIDQIQSCLRVSLLALGMETFVVLLEEPVLSVLLVMKEVEVVDAELLPQGEVEEHDREQSATESIDVCLVDYIVRTLQKYFWSLIFGCADLMAEHRPKVFSMTEVNECQTLRVCEHYIVWLNVTMSDTLNRVEVEDGITYLPANNLLQSHS